MRLSLIFELLLIFLLLAFAASAVIDSRGTNNRRKSTVSKRGKVGNRNRQDSAPNKYCSCSTKLCNCCREFNIPVVALQGPGCASLQYLKGDRLAISMSFGERVLANTTISSKRPKPVCMPLPGGVSKFCGRVYNIGRKGVDFNACLGLELHALEDVEAAVRVACFRFGPQGLRVEPSQPLPVVENEAEDDDDADDDEDDDDDDDVEYDDDDNDVDTSDYGAFSVFGDDIIDSFFAGSDTDSEDAKPTKKVTTTTKAPVKKATKKPAVSTQNRRKVTTPKPIKSTVSTPEVTTNSTAEKKPELILSNQTDNTQPPAPHESIAAVTAMLQEIPGGMMSPIAESVDALNTSAEITTVVAEGVKSAEELDEPVTQAVDENKNKKVKGDTEDSEDIVDDIMEGVAETITFDDGESDDTKNKTSNATSSSEEDDDDDSDEDDDDEESKQFKPLNTSRKRARQTKHMRLDRLHW